MMKEEPYVIEAKQYKLMRLAILILLLLACTGWLTTIFVGNVVMIECQDKYGTNKIDNLDEVFINEQIGQAKKRTNATSRNETTT